MCSGCISWQSAKKKNAVLWCLNQVINRADSDPDVKCYGLLM